MSGDAKLLYAVLLDRMSLSIKNGWQDKHGNAYIICTIEAVSYTHLDVYKRQDYNRLILGHMLIMYMNAGFVFTI